MSRLAVVAIVVVLTGCAGEHVTGDAVHDAGTSLDDAAADAEAPPTDAGSPVSSELWAPVSPTAAARVDSAPTLRVRRVSGSAASAHVDVCTDRGCASVVRSFDSVVDSVVVTPPLDVGRYFWRPVVVGVPGATWAFSVTSAPSPLRPPPYVDVNGDGYADVITEVSGLVTFAGSSAGPLPTPHVDIAYMDELSLVGVGDFDGDGLGDILENGTTQHPIHPGSPVGVASYGNDYIPGADEHDVDVGIGDVDGDGHADIVYATPRVCRTAIVHGVPFPSPGSTADDYSTWTADACPIVGPLWWDANANGTVDFALGFPDAARVDAIDGLAPTGPPIATWSGVVGSQFGTRVVGVGDVDGDGDGDVAVLQLSPPEVVVELSSGGVRNVPFSLVASALPNVTPIGDLDLDGYDDFAIGDATARVVFGGATTFDTVDLGLGVPYVPVPISGPGDINGDGAPDLVVGQPYVPAPSMLVFYGGSRTLASPLLLDGGGQGVFGAVVATH